MAGDVSLHNEASSHPCEAYTKEIKFSPDNTVDVSSLTTDEKRKLLLHCVEKDVTSVTVENFLSTHDQHQLRDVNVEGMRKIIPKLFMYYDERDVSYCKRVKGLWDSRPKWWRADVPFMDPNNRKRSKHEAGFPAKKPTKDELLSMLEYLFELCKEKMGQNATVTPAVSLADGTLPSSISYQSALSCDSWAANSSVLSPLSVRTFDDPMDIDNDCASSPTSTSLQSCQSWGHTSSDAAINLDTVYQQICILPRSEQQQLMMDVHNILRQQNQTSLTAPELTQLKQEIKVLVDAVSSYHANQLSIEKLTSIKAKYGSGSRFLSTSDVSSADVVKNETVAMCHRYSSHSITGQRHLSAADSVDENLTSDLSADQDLLLTDISDVISFDTTENCDISTSSVPCVPTCQLEPAISSARMTTELALSEAVASKVSVSSPVVCLAAASPTAQCSDNTVNSLPCLESHSLSRSDRLLAAVSADQKQQNLPHSPT